MSNGRNKYQSRENRQRVRDVLMDHWDPVGVKGISECVDEYDGYVGRVYVMLMDESASDIEIRDYLYQEATGHMGLSPSEALTEKCGIAAALLLSLKPQFGSH